MAAPAMIATSLIASIAGETESVGPMKRWANRGAVKGMSAVLAMSVISTSVVSNPIKAASAGAAIIGDATPWSISPRNNSGALSDKPNA